MLRGFNALPQSQAVATPFKTLASDFYEPAKYHETVALTDMIIAAAAMITAAMSKPRAVLERALRIRSAAKVPKIMVASEAIGVANPATETTIVATSNQLAFAFWSRMRFDKSSVGSVMICSSIAIVQRCSYATSSPSSVV